MTATNHALTGAAVAIAFRQPVLALPLALVSHFVCDAIPHWDYSVKFPRRQRIIALDLLFASVVVATIALLSVTFSVKAWVIVACAILAVPPDGMWFPQILKGEPIPMNGNTLLYLMRRFHRWIQWNESRRAFYTEIGWFLLIALYVFTRYYFLTTSPK